MVDQDAPQAKRPRKKSRRRAAGPETLYYIVEIKDWEGDFTFGVNTIKDRDDP